ncbi:MAG: acetyl-CoA hydrolase/transferase family protein [Ruminococcaceae bacterium]|nr:acetyl-CoA hydrolase/transferase family protein [Oscillospiraceae bacterium]
MSWHKYYEAHLTTADEAVKNIKSGNRVVLGHACGEPGALVEAMVNNAENYQDVEIVHMFSLAACAYCRPEMKGHFRHNALFVCGPTREAVNAARGDYTPSFFFQVPELFRTTMPVDVAMVTLTPPNEEGMMSLGTSADYDYAAIKEAKIVIAQINRQMPFTYGNLIPVEDVDFFVEHDAPIPELPAAKIGEIERAIGEHCASLIQDGDTLQLGIGAIPDAVLMFLKDKKDLGLHSEMLSDGVVDLANAGIINNTRKTLNPGKFVANFMMGSKRLYDFADHNEDVLIMPVDYVNHPMIIGQHDRLVSINSCVQVDLMGQVGSEMIGTTQISGIGGQVDFVRGAALSKGGISIIAMPSTVKGKVSKIVPQLDFGAAVTTSRSDVDYIVTEYGIAHLKGQTLRERAKRLIAIAHPAFREDLMQEYRKRFGAED